MKVIRSLAALACLALVAACAGGDDSADAESTTTSAAGDTSSTTSGGSASGEGVTIGDDGRLVPAACDGTGNTADETIGVTETSVNVATLSIDFSVLAQIGFAASGTDVRGFFQAFVDDLNDRGGICGRTIDYQGVLYDIIRREGALGCTQVTQDRANFMVLVQGGTPEAVCVAETGVVTYAQHDFAEAEVTGVVDHTFMRTPSIDEQYTAYTQWALDEGLLEGQTVGVWYGSVFLPQGDVVEEQILPMLDDAGVEHIDFRTDFLGPSDPQGNTALLTAAGEFASAGIDVLLNFTASTNHTGMQAELAAQGVTPVYLSAPVSGNSSNDIFAEAGGVTEIADGEQIFSFTYAPNEAADTDLPALASCAAQYEELTGEALEPGTFDYAAMTNMCHQFDMLVAALSIVGADASQEALIAAMESLPPHPTGLAYGPEAWTADDHFGTDVFGVHLYDGASNTYTTTEIFE